MGTGILYLFPAEPANGLLKRSFCRALFCLSKNSFSFFDAGGCLRADFSGVSGRRSVWHSPENKKQMIFKKLQSQILWDKGLRI